MHFRSVILLAIAFSLPATAGRAHERHELKRWLGVCWSDGYHVCYRNCGCYGPGWPMSPYGSFETYGPYNSRQPYADPNMALPPAEPLQALPVEGRPTGLNYRRPSPVAPAPRFGTPQPANWPPHIPR